LYLISIRIVASLYLVSITAVFCQLSYYVKVAEQAALVLGKELRVPLVGGWMKTRNPQYDETYRSVHVYQESKFDSSVESLD
jgi:hypothetical protein